MAVRDTVNEELARIGQALSSPHRLHMLHLLAQGPKTIQRLATETEQTEASASAHLKALRGAHLVVTEKVGREVWCRLASDEVLRYVVATRALGRALLPEVGAVDREWRADAFDLAGAALGDLVRRAARGQLVLVDLRAPDEYAAGHLPHARSLPFAELSARHKELPRARKVLAYCRGPFCARAREGVELIRKKGVDAWRLDLGVAEWTAASLPLERTSA